MANNHCYQQPGFKKSVTLVHNKYNSPLGLYSTEEVAETLQRHTRILGNGAVGVDFGLLAVPNLKKSEVYKMLSEEEPQLRYMHKQQISAVTSEFSGKRVAWPPPTNPFEKTETHKHGYDYGIIGIGIPVQQHPDTYILEQQKQDAYVSPKQQQNDFISKKQQDYNEIPRKEQQCQNRPEDLPLPVIQKSPKVPPPPPPRNHRKPILRSSSDAQDPFAKSGGSEFEQYSDTFHQQPSAIQQDREPKSEEKSSSVSSRRMPEPFASNELVGERMLIAKPAPPPGLLLRPAAVKKSAGFMRENPMIRTESFFRRGTTPVRMLGDMVWPPKGLTSTTDTQQLPTRSPGAVRRQPKNYRDFFSQNQLPANFPTYRAPPGTQHFGLEEGENATPM